MNFLPRSGIGTLLVPGLLSFLLLGTTGCTAGIPTGVEAPSLSSLRPLVLPEGSNPDLGPRENRLRLVEFWATW